jgi:hypothetical protein
MKKFQKTIVTKYNEWHRKKEGKSINIRPTIRSLTHQPSCSCTVLYGSSMEFSTEELFSDWFIRERQLIMFLALSRGHLENKGIDLCSEGLTKIK